MKFSGTVEVFWLIHKYGFIMGKINQWFLLEIYLNKAYFTSNNLLTFILNKIELNFDYNKCIKYLSKTMFKTLPYKLFAAVSCLAPFLIILVRTIDFFVFLHDLLVGDF